MGMEQYGNICLLRSLTVKVEERKNGLADKLIKEVTDFAVNAKCVEAYLITSTVVDKMRKHGFESIDRTELPEAIKKSKFFIEICPLSSVVMNKNQSC